MKFLDVKAHGALGNGQVDDSSALMNAFAYASENQIKKIYIPNGTYRIGSTLRVPNGLHLQADEHAVLRLADNACVDHTNYLLTNEDMTSGCDISIEGGTWDANNEGNPRGLDGPIDSYTGVAINFIKMTNLTLRGMKVVNPESFFVRLGQVDGFLIEKIELSAPHVRPNQDGIHLGGGCSNGMIRDIVASGKDCPNDDMVAINANDDVLRAINLGMIQGPIKNITVDDIKSDSAYTFVRLLSRDQPIRDIVIRRISGTCRVNALNINRWKYAEGQGNIAGVRIEDVWVSKCLEASNHDPLIDVSLAVEDMTIKQFHRLDTREDVDTVRIATQYACDIQLKRKEDYDRSVTVNNTCWDYRISQCPVLGPKDVLKIPNGGFEYLRIRQSRMNQSP